MSTQLSLFVSVDSKRCGRCRVVHPKSHFTASKQTPDGLFGWCKSCHNRYKRQRQYRRRSAAKNAEILDHRFLKSIGWHRCPACNISKPKSGFYEDSGSTLGHTSLCKPCAKARQKRLRYGARTSEENAAFLEGQFLRSINRRRCAVCESIKASSAYYDGHGTCKACVLEKQRAYLKKNRDKRRAYSRAYRRRNRDRLRRKNREWYWANREKNIAQSRAYYRQNRRRMLKQSRQWAQSNPEAAREIKRRYHRRHPERVKISKAAYRKRHRSAGGHATPKQVAARVEYFGRRCYICADPYDAIDHVKPISEGGTHWPCNLRPICLTCNSAKGGKWPLSKIDMCSELSHVVESQLS